MTKKEAVKALNDMSAGDNEAVHSDADEILVQVLEKLAPEVAKAYRDLQARVKFWYA